MRSRHQLGRSADPHADRHPDQRLAITISTIDAQQRDAARTRRPRATSLEPDAVARARRSTLSQATATRTSATTSPSQERRVGQARHATSSASDAQGVGRPCARRAGRGQPAATASPAEAGEPARGWLTSPLGEPGAAERGRSIHGCAPVAAARRSARSGTCPPRRPPGGNSELVVGRGSPTERSPGNRPERPHGMSLLLDRDARA